MPVLDKILLCQRKIGNAHDPFANKQWKYCRTFAETAKLNVFLISEERGECSRVRLQTQTNGI